MAGIITHMAVANEVRKRLPPDVIQDMGLFFMGNLAPDAVHCREGYIRAYKKRTHFREDIVDRDFIKEENQSLFHQRLAAFIGENTGREAGTLDQYRGYAAHNLTDELYLLTLRQEFCEVMEQQGIDQSNPLFFQTIITDMRRNDYLLMKNYDGIEEIRRCVEQAPLLPVEGYVSEEEMAAFRDWMLQKHFYQENEYLEPVYISFDKTLDFIQRSAGDIIERLSDGISFPKLL